MDVVSAPPPSTASVLVDLERKPTSLTAAAHGLRSVADRLHAVGDPRAAFPDIYGLITDRVLVEAETPGGLFCEPAWLSRLSGRFCERYLETLAWSLAHQDQDCSAWRIAYRACATRATVPYQDVVLGLSAHINFDLAQGIAQTIEEFGTARDPEKRARYKHDHDAVNVLLEESIPRAFERLIAAYGCRTSAVLWAPRGRSLTFRMTMRVLAYFRANVWTDVIALLDARDATERDRVIAAMEARSGRYAKMLTAGNFAYLEARRRLRERGRLL